MKNIESKKIAAALAAVNLFIEQERLYQESLETAKPKQVKPADYTPKKEEMLKEVRGVATGWATLGRIQSMNTRVLWQLKLYK